MRSVAAEIGVQAASLYRYVKNRAELDDFLFDHLMADCSAKLVGKDWRAHVRSIANAWRARLVGKRDATRIAINQVSIGPNVLPLMEASLSALRKSGLNDRDLIEAYQTCVLFVHSFATSEASYKSLLARNDGSAPRFSPIKPEWIKPFPTLASLATQMARPVDFDRRFAFGLNVIIAGIEQQALRK
jgi:hypothetical protein